MQWQAWITILVLAAVVVGLVRFPHVTEVIFMGALGIVTLVGVITPAEAFAGFKNEGVITVGALFVVAGGLVQTGVLGALTDWLLGHANTSQTALRRVLPPLVAASAFLNNTTVVAMSMPALVEWSRRRRIATSRLLLPLSYASIVGGVCTLIGTSTNLVVHGLMQQQKDKPTLVDGLAMWEIGWVGVPIAIVGTIYLVFVVSHLLPDRKEFLEQLGETAREYLTELVVEDGCPLIHKTVQEAGLRGLPGLFLIEIQRQGELVSPVGPDERLCAGDRLVFTGVVSTIVDLQKIPGLRPPAAPSERVSGDRLRGRRLCEAVVSTSSPLAGKGIREANFRTVYDAVVVAVHRNGRRIQDKIGNIRLEPGDTLLLEAGPGFVRLHRNNPDFYLVSEVGDASPMRSERAWIAAGITLGLILLLTMSEALRWFSVPASVLDWFEDQRVTFAVLAAGAMVITRCVSSSDARRSIEWSVLLAIAASFGVGTALAKSGAAAGIANGAVGLFGGWGPIGVLTGIYLVTWLLTEAMSNNAAAALMFPVAVATAHQMHLDPRPFAITLAIAASGGFLFPAGYQTHLMVFGPGGYRVSDFIKVGLPMALIWLVLTVLLVPIFWPLRAVGG